MRQGVAFLHTRGCISAYRGLHFRPQGVAFPRPMRLHFYPQGVASPLAGGCIRGCIDFCQGVASGFYRLSRGCTGGFISPLRGFRHSQGVHKGLRRRSQGVAFKQAADDSQPPSATLVIFTAYRLSTDKFSITGCLELARLMSGNREKI